MLKRKSRAVLIDRFHKGFVWTCIGMTLYGGYLLSDHFYKYFVYVKPRLEAEKEKKLQELLSEGSSDRIAALRDIESGMKA